MIAVVGCCERARLAAVPAPRRPRLAERRALAGAGTTPRSTPSGPRCWRCRSRATSASRGCSSRPRPPASALLVAFSGRRDALEAGWKYLVLTTLGLSVALLGIVVLAIGQAGTGHTASHALDWHALELTPPRSPTTRRRSSRSCSSSAAWRRRSAGRRCTTGCPTPTARRPPPISALLSAALLPTVLLVAWRVKSALDVAVGAWHRRRAVHRLRAGVDDRRRPVPVAPAAVEAAAGLLEPRAHGRASRSGSASAPARDRGRACCTSPATRSPSRSGSTPPLPLAARRADRRRSRPPTGVAAREPATAARDGRRLVALGRAAAVAAVRLRAADRARRRRRRRSGGRRRRGRGCSRSASSGWCTRCWRASSGEPGEPARRARPTARTRAPDGGPHRCAGAAGCSRSDGAPRCCCRARTSWRRSCGGAVTLERVAAAALARRASPTRSPRGARFAGRRRAAPTARRWLRTRCSPGRDGARRCACRRRDGRRRHDRRPLPGAPTGTSARRTTCDGLRFAGHEPLARARRAPGRARGLDDARRRRRRAPGRGRPDPRRRDRVRPLPLPRRRRARSCALDARLFYKHRGLERAAEGRSARRGSAVRAARLRGLRGGQHRRLRAGRSRTRSGCGPTATLRVARTLLLELERLYNHLHDIGAICAGVGFAPGAMAFAALKERAQRAQRRRRRPPLPVRDGRGRRAPLSRSTARGRRRPRASCASCAPTPPPRGASSCSPRRCRSASNGIGVLDAEDAERLGAVGPAARASGLRDDARAATARGWPTTASSRRARRRGAGDVAGAPASCAPPSSRRPTTCSTSCSPALCRPAPRRSSAVAPRARRRARREPARRHDVRRRRCATGGSRACICAPARTRTGRRSRMPRPSNLLPDFPLINKSFELCYACVDR